MLTKGCLRRGIHGLAGLILAGVILPGSSCSVVIDENGLDVEFPGGFVIVDGGVDVDFPGGSVVIE